LNRPQKNWPNAVRLMQPKVPEIQHNKGIQKQSRKTLNDRKKKKLYRMPGKKKRPDRKSGMPP